MQLHRSAINPRTISGNDVCQYITIPACLPGAWAYPAPLQGKDDLHTGALTGSGTHE